MRMVPDKEPRRDYSAPEERTNIYCTFLALDLGGHSVYLGNFVCRFSLSLGPNLSRDISMLFFGCFFFVRTSYIVLHCTLVRNIIVYNLSVVNMLIFPVIS